MPKKKFEEVEYDPFAAEEERTKAASKVSGGGDVATETRPAPKPQAAPLRVADVPRPAAPEPPVRTQAQEVAPPSYGPTKRFKVTEEEDSAFEEFILRLRSASGSKVDFSVLSRVFWAVAQHGERQLIEALQKSRPPKRPSKNKPLDMAEYEAAWVEAAITAFRRMPPPPK